MRLLKLQVSFINSSREMVRSPSPSRQLKMSSMSCLLGNVAPVTLVKYLMISINENLVSRPSVLMCFQNNLVRNCSVLIYVTTAFDADILLSFIVIFIFYMRRITQFAIQCILNFQSLCIGLFLMKTNKPRSESAHLQHTLKQKKVKPSINNQMKKNTSHDYQQKHEQQLPSIKQAFDQNLANNEELKLKNLIKNQISMIITQQEKKYSKVNPKMNEEILPANPSQSSMQEKEDLMKLMKKKIFNIIEKAERSQYVEDKSKEQKIQQTNMIPIKYKDNPRLQKNISFSLQQDPKDKVLNGSIEKKKKLIRNVDQKKHKKIKTEEPLGNSSVVRKYELNMDKFEKIENVREQIFKTRPKLSSTPGLIIEKPSDNTVAVVKKTKKNKTEPNTNLNSPVLNREKKMQRKLELPQIPKKSHVLYTQASKCYDILSNISQSLKVSKKNQQIGFGYRPVSLGLEKQEQNGYQSTKGLRKRRLNYFKISKV